MPASRATLQATVDARWYNWTIVGAAYLAVFLEPGWAVWSFLRHGVPPGMMQHAAVFTLTALTTLLFAADFLINLRLQGASYFRYSSAWINLLIVGDFVVTLVSHVVPLDPVVLRLLRTTGVVGRLGLLQKAGRLESNLASLEIVRSNEDDIKYSIVLLVAFSLLFWKVSWHDYTSVGDPLLELAVYFAIIIAVRYKVYRNWQRLRDNIINPLGRLTDQNRSKLVSLLGERRAAEITDEVVDRCAQQGKTEIDLIVEHMDIIFNHLQKFVSERTLRESRGETVIPPGQPIAMVFSDIEDFAKATQAMQGDVIPVLGMYLATMSAAILRNGGDIEKFIGDAIFSFHHDHRDPGQSANHAFDAVTDCTASVQQLWNQPEWRALFEHGGHEAFKNFRSRYGLHHGAVCAGPIGSVEEQLRVESTLLGDHVNITARLEGLCKYYGIYNLMSTDFFDHLSADRQRRCRLVDYITVKGREGQPFQVYTIDGDELPQAFLEHYELGLADYFAGEWGPALEHLRRAVEMRPDDGPARALVERIEYSKRYSLMAIDNLSRKCEIRALGLTEVRRQLEDAIEGAPWVPPMGFVDRGGYWRWEVK